MTLVKREALMAEAKRIEAALDRYRAWYKKRLAEEATLIAQLQSHRAQTRRICEVLRELFDKTHCGLILCGTDVLTTDLFNGQDAGLLDQIVQRAIEVRLPRRLPLADVAKVAAAHGLPAELPETLKSAVRDLRMNRLVLISAMAAEAAAKRGVPPDWPLWLATKTALLGE